MFFCCTLGIEWEAFACLGRSKEAREAESNLRNQNYIIKLIYR